MFHDSKVLKMDGQNKRFVRFHNTGSLSPDVYGKPAFDIETPKRLHRSLLSPIKIGLEKSSKSWRGFGRSFHFGAARVHSEEYESKQRNIWDPSSNFLHQWNSLFSLACLAAIFIDPLFYYLPVVNNDEVCLDIDKHLAIVVTALRTITDIFYLFHMGVQFRTGFIAPSSHILGRGELVSDPVLIAKRYLRRMFIVDLVAVLPLPQIVIWVVIPALRGTTADNTKNALRLIILLQYIPRLYPLFQNFVKPTGRMTDTAGAAAAYNLLLYMLASHLFGACWYLLAIEREDRCWRDACTPETFCRLEFLDCSSLSNSGNEDRDLWNISNVQQTCQPTTITIQNIAFQFGIYSNAFTNNILTTKKFVDKYFYCFWWGLQNLSTLGQGLQTSSYVGENIFSIVLAILGLILFARLIGNMQTYLQSLTVKFEEMRLKRHDAEQWMEHRQLPTELRERVRNYDQYKWLETRGVKEEELVMSLPKDLRRDIKRHLCLALVKAVPLFSNMDDRLLDAICERLQPALFTPGTDVMREGDPVNEMLFIIRGHLKSETTNGGRTGFLNVGKLQPGHFCGEELLTWALDPKSGGNLPSSTRSVSAETEVETFSLRADDLKFVATQFRRMHSKQVQHTFRHYSQQWQTWAACSIQSAWRRYQRRKLAELRRIEEDHDLQTKMQGNLNFVNPSLGTALYASRFATNAMRAVHRQRGLRAAEGSLSSLKLQKPSEPDFSVEEGD